MKSQPQVNANHNHKLTFYSHGNAVNTKVAHNGELFLLCELIKGSL